MSDELRAWLAEAIERHHVPLGERLTRIETLLEGLPKIMSDALATALAPLDAGITQNSADILNLGSVVSADFAALQGSITALQGSIAAGTTIPAADMADIANQVSVLAQAHSALTAVIAGLGTVAPAA